MIVVTTPTGRIGSQLIPHLIAAGEAVRVIARHPAKLAQEITSKVEILTGSMEDDTVLENALRDIESVFHVVPPSPEENNDEAYYLRFTRPLLKAMKSRGVKRIVSVSVLGRGTALAKNAGPATASLSKDEEIVKSGVDFRALWCASLMENILTDVKNTSEQGLFTSPSHPDVKTPQVAIRDVSKMGAKLLLDRSWTGQGGNAVLGPEDLSYTEMAAIMTEVLERSVRFQQVSADAYTAQLIQHGTNPVFAQGTVDMLIAKDNGMDSFEIRTPENTTPTSFKTWCEELLKPALLRC